MEALAVIEIAGKYRLTRGPIRCPGNALPASRFDKDNEKLALPTGVGYFPALPITIVVVAGLFYVLNR